MQELFIYDREKGLFKEILNQSQVFQGRYHVSPSMGADLNTNNLETYIKDPQNGLETDLQKYPLVVCVTPRSRYINFSGGRQEEFTFNLYFICPTYVTGDNKIKSRDADTNTSTHHVWYDWQDMKDCADQFITVLKQVLRRTTMIDGLNLPLKTRINFDDKNIIVNRLTKFNSDRLSGIGLTFNMFINSPICELADYPDTDDIIIPPLIIHESHNDE